MKIEIREVLDTYYVYVGGKFLLSFDKTTNIEGLQERLKEIIEDALSKGTNVGYESGKKQGRLDGLEKGFSEGYEEGHIIGYNEGHEKGYKEGYDNGCKDTRQEEYEDYIKGYQDGSRPYNEGANEGYKKGYDEGYRRGRQEVATAMKDQALIWLGKISRNKHIYD